MSYDVAAGGDWHNITSNLQRFFRDFDVYPPDWDGMPRAEVAARIDAALARISEIPLGTLRDKYDAANGWGIVPHGIEFLEKVRDSCRRELPKTVSVSW